MSQTRNLVTLFETSRERFPSKTAVTVPDGPSISYAELGALSDGLRDRLRHLGVGPGDRVGIRLRKSLESVGAIFGILKAGAAYVPVDAESPAARGAFIFGDCGVKVVITEADIAESLAGELAAANAAPRLLVLDPPAADGRRLTRLLASLQASDPAPAAASSDPASADLAYILYTSGSTGRPKGVMLSHGNATSFIDWCSDVFLPTPDDVFSSHAPFHFDLSILDIYVPLKHGATLTLIGESLGKDPAKLAAAIASSRISVWYSTPSILSLLADYGKLERYDYSALRLVFFAGEVFGLPRFEALLAKWPAPRYFNLYGPTETNVCTFYEVPADGSWRDAPTFPIGGICPPNRGMVVDEHDKPVEAGALGELVVWGPNVMQGYWNLPEQNERAFLVDASGARWYHTGDIVAEKAGGMYVYAGRRDRMVKRRGYRVELGEIESVLFRYPDVRETAVVSVPDPESGVRIVAFVVPATPGGITIVGLKKLSSQGLPPYMVPDTFKVVEALPRTSTDKIDLQALQSLARA
jgi:amino acid adenylation domain-containing protein